MEKYFDIKYVYFSRLFFLEFLSISWFYIIIIQNAKSAESEHEKILQ